MEAKEIIEKLKENFLAKDSGQEYQINHPETALTCLFQIFAQERLSPDLVDQMIPLLTQEQAAWREELRGRLSQFLPGLLESNFYHESESTRHISPAEISMNTFVGYWTVASYLNEHTNLLPEDADLKNKFAHLIKQSKPYKLNLKFQDLTRVNLSYVELSEVDFSYANMERTVLIHAKITDSVFYNTDLDQANLDNCDLSDCYLSFASMVDTKLVDAILNEVNLHGANLKGADLSRADLSEAHLDQANLYQADLTLADLRGASLIRADLSLTNLSKANFNRSRLNGASLEQAILYQSNFSEADIQEADLDTKTMVKADFTGALMAPETKAYLKRQGAIVD